MSRAKKEAAKRPKYRITDAHGGSGVVCRVYPDKGKSRFLQEYYNMSAHHKYVRYKEIIHNPRHPDLNRRSDRTLIITQI